jgi:hypothetical protein
LSAPEPRSLNPTMATTLAATFNASLRPTIAPSPLRVRLAHAAIVSLG